MIFPMMTSVGPVQGLKQVKESICLIFFIHTAKREAESNSIVLFPISLSFFSFLIFGSFRMYIGYTNIIC